MSVAGRKGLVGENGVMWYINLWFPYADQGIGAKRIRSQGSKDIGDIDGVPYTCIEVKNHSNSVSKTSGLLDNAQWKADNANRPIWFLAYKRDGFSESRAHRWHSMTTLKGFLDGIKPVVRNPENGELLEAFNLGNVSDLCYSYTDMDAEIGQMGLPGIVQPENKWRLRIMFRPYKGSAQERRDQDIDPFVNADPGGEYTPDKMIVPIVITPRIGDREQDIESWYVYTTLHYQVRMLETIGVVPQDQNEYIK